MNVMERPTFVSPRESGRVIAELAQHVSVDCEGIKSLAEKVFQMVCNKTIHMDMFSQHELHPVSSDPSAIDWIFVVDTLNFCFWSTDEDLHWTVSYNGKAYTGYYALCAALMRAKDEGMTLSEPNSYCKITTSDLARLLRSDEGCPEVPLIEERAQCLREVGNILISKYQGSFVNCVKSCDGSAEDLLCLIVTEFPCFRDEAIYKEHAVSFYKRAQILVGDIWVCFHGKGLGSFRDMEVLTMFPDYRVPQVLVHFGVLKYSAELFNKLQSGEILSSGCAEECEIRGCTIHAVELVCTRAKMLLAEKGGTSAYFINPVLIDYFLWEYRRNHAEKLSSIPFHKVLSVFY